MKSLINFPKNLDNKNALIISEEGSLVKHLVNTYNLYMVNTKVITFTEFESNYNNMKIEKWDIIIFDPFSMPLDARRDNSQQLDNYIHQIGSFFNNFIDLLSNPCSILSLLPLDYYNSYMNRPNVASLCGLIHGYVKTIAIDYAHRSIRANSVILGYIKNDPIFSFSSDFNSIENRTPISRIPTIDELIMPILFLSSDAAEFATGQDFAIDGGLSSTWGFDTSVDYPGSLKI